MAASRSRRAKTELAAQARQILGSVAALSVLGLTATGIWLGFFYSPDAAQAWNDINALARDVEWGMRIRQIHGLLALAAPVLVAVWLVLAVAARLQRRALLLASYFVAVIVALVSGFIAPWRASVLLEGAQFGSTEIGGWVALHLLAGGVVVMLTGFALLPTRKRGLPF